MALGGPCLHAGWRAGRGRPGPDPERRAAGPPRRRACSSVCSSALTRHRATPASRHLGNVTGEQALKARARGAPARPASASELLCERSWGGRLQGSPQSRDRARSLHERRFSGAWHPAAGSTRGSKPSSPPRRPRLPLSQSSHSTAHPGGARPSAAVPAAAARPSPPLPARILAESPLAPGLHR